MKTIVASAIAPTRLVAMALVTVLATLVAPLVAAAPAQADCAGVTVVVDFGAYGGVQAGCAGGDPGSGIAALTAAGFSYTSPPNLPGFVCQISGAPDRCTAPQPDAYWSYWDGSSGSWSYNNSGAGSRNPAPGDVEGWSFGSGSAPAVAPPQPVPPPQPDPDPEPQPNDPGPGQDPGTDPQPGPEPDPHPQQPNDSAPQPEPTSGDAPPGTTVEQPPANSAAATENPTATRADVTLQGQALDGPPDATGSDRGVASWVVGAAAVTAMSTFAFVTGRIRRKRPNQ